MRFHLDADQSQSVAIIARTAHRLDVTSSHERAMDHLARAMAWFHAQYSDGVPPYFVGYLKDPPDMASGGLLR